MEIVKFLLKRSGYVVVSLFGLSILIFLISRVLPGDPARMALGPRAPEWVVQRLREQLHLNEPLYIQYYWWLSGAIHGDFGESLYTRRPVIDDVKEFLPATGELVLFASIVEAFLGLGLGIVSGRYRNTWIDHSTRMLAYLGVATPAFAFAVLFLLLFGYLLDILPTAGRLSPEIARPPVVTGMVLIDSLIVGNLSAFGDALKHMVLPGISMALGGMAQLARITRVSVSEHLEKEYIFALRQYGVPEWRIVLKYLLKPSFIAPISILGLQIGSLFGNAFLVELVFNWPGISRYGINAMLRKDLNATAAVVLIMGVIYIIVNLLVDIAVAFLDPRIRLGEERGGVKHAAN